MKKKNSISLLKASNIIFVVQVFLCIMLFFTNNNFFYKLVISFNILNGLIGFCLFKELSIYKKASLILLFILMSYLLAMFFLDEKISPIATLIPKVALFLIVIESCVLGIAKKEDIVISISQSVILLIYLFIPFLDPGKNLIVASIFLLLLFLFFMIFKIKPTDRILYFIFLSIFIFNLYLKIN